jgi:hypothetical protein
VTSIYVNGAAEIDMKDKSPSILFLVTARTCKFGGMADQLMDPVKPRSFQINCDPKVDAGVPLNAKIVIVVPTIKELGAEQQSTLIC